MKRVIFSLVIVLMLVMMACSHAANLLPEVQQAAGTWPRCNSGCTANDAVAVDAWIVANPDCTPGQNNTAEIWLTFGITRQKGPFCAVVVMDIYVDYFLTYDEYNITIGDLPGKGSWNYSIANITWPCGAVLELRDIYVQWMTNDQDPCGENCGDYPPSKCWMGGPLYVRAPLVADFEFDSVCFCNNTTFTDKTTGGEGFYTYDWDFGDSLGTSTEQNPIYHYASNGTYTVTLNVTDSDSPPNIDSQSYNVTVNEKPTATASSNSPVCEGATIELYGGPGGMTSYSWTGPNGFSSSLQNPTIPNAIILNAGTYYLTVTDGGCTSDPASTAVVVGTKPTASSSSNSPICEGSTIVLTGGPGGMTSYSWTGPNGFSSSLQNPTIPSATTLNAGTYYLTVTDGGCTSDLASTTVVVGTKPTASSSSNSPICEGSTIVLTGGPGGMTSYSWTGPNGFSSSLQNPTIPSATTLNAGTYYLTVTDGGCTSDPASTVVVVNTKPTATASSNSPVSEGATIQLYGGPDGMTSYSWTGPGGWTSMLQNPTRTGATTTMAGTYTLTVTNSNGCTDNESTSVTVNAKPEASASSNSPLCEGSTIVLTGGPGGMTSYSWTGPNGFSSSLQNPTIPNATTLNAGTYYLTVTDGGCVSNPASTVVVVNTKPTATASSNPPVSEGATIQLYGGPDGMTSYSWTGPGGWTSILQNPTRTGATLAMAGTYILTVTNSNDCTDDESTSVTVNAKPTASAPYILPECMCRGLMISSTEGGSVTTPGEGELSYVVDTVVGLVASPDPGYKFINWSGDVATIADIHDASTNITMSGWYSITANFEPEEVGCNLTISSTEGGSVISTGEGTFVYEAGTVVDLLAQPEEGYQFVKWTGDVSAIADVYVTSTTIIMNADYSITANFEAISAIQYKLTLSSTTGGSVTTPGEGIFTYDEGTVVTLVSTPDPGYQFTSWLGDVDTIADVNAASITITMDDNYSITGTFRTVGGCFIATAAYGTPTAEQIDVLREFRDIVLLESTAGSQFVALYYQLSPPVADFIAGNELLRTLVRELLVDSIVWIVEATGDMWRN